MNGDGIVWVPKVDKSSGVKFAYSFLKDVREIFLQEKLTLHYIGKEKPYIVFLLYDYSFLFYLDFLCFLLCYL